MALGRSSAGSKRCCSPRSMDVHGMGSSEHLCVGPVMEGAGTSAHLCSCHGDRGTVLLVLVGFSSSLSVLAGLHGFRFPLVSPS